MDTGLPQLTRHDRTGWSAPWLAWLDAALHREMLRLRARYELSTDELHGLYVSDEQVDRLVRRQPPTPEAAEDLEALDRRRESLLRDALAGSAAAADSPSDSPLGQLARRFELDEASLLAVVVCLAPEMELAYQSVYAYLNDDVTRRLPTVDLCARLCDGAALEPDGPAVRDGLLEPVRVETAPLWRSAGLLLAEPARRFLLSAYQPPVLTPGRHTSGLLGQPVRMTSRRFGAAGETRMVVLESHSEQDAALVAAEVADEAGDRLVRPHGEGEGGHLRALGQALLTARIEQRALLVTASDLGLPPDGPVGAEGAALLHRLAAAPVRAILVVPPGRAASLPLEGADVHRISVERPDVAERTDRWRAELDALGIGADAADLDHVAGLFGLGRAQITTAARTVARGLSDPTGARAGRELLTAAARESSTRDLDGIAEEVATHYRWDDLVLPPATLRRVVELAEAVRHRHRVFGAWSFGRLTGGHASIRALFSGPSGTGKTMSAAVVAGDLGLPLYRVDLSSVVSKYVGETEKNIERILSAAESSNAMLLFDEADALFGKRTEVKDAHDRYANIETAYLLQRIESFDGVVVLATNLAGNLDEAFGRRIHFQVEFPVPDQGLRAQLWRRAVPRAAPVADDFDPDFLAGMFTMTGGDIRNAALMAAFMAAREETPIAMSHLVRALARQRRLQGKVPSVSEFRDYLRLVRDEDS